ncbi:MAG TPA: helix-turn-helix domain-containing protein [Acidimicrobiales bacterium]|nr:helix-turn-helix domain-containing protein [Acidimicrobiales bacterium]
MVRAGGQGSRAARDEIAVAPAPEGLQSEFEALGLSPYESSVLLALLRIGSGNSLQLARISGVPRTSTYQVLEALTVRRLAVRVPGEGPAVWASPGRDEVLARLDAAEQEKLRLYRERAERVRTMLAEALPEVPTVAMPYLQVIKGPAQTRDIYDRMLADAKEEFLVFNRPPYSAAANPVHVLAKEAEARDEVNPEVLEALHRGVAIRTLYQAEQWEDEAAADFREAMAAYHRAGVKGRLVEDLPIKLAVADRRIAIVTMMDPSLPEIGFPTTLLIEHPGAAAVQAQAFDRYWAQGRPCPKPVRRREPKASIA